MHKQHPQTAYLKDAVLIGTIFENCDKKGGCRTAFVQQPPFGWENLSFRYAGASADAPAYHFYREDFCSNRSVMLHRLMPRVERLCSMALVAGGRMPRAPRRMRAELKLSHPTKSSLRCVVGIFLFRGRLHLENFMSRPSVIPTFCQRRCTNRGRTFVRSKR